MDEKLRASIWKNYFKNIMSKVRSALGYAVHSHGCVSLNIIWRWPRSSTVDSSPSHTPWSPPTPFDASLIQRPCDYVSVPAPPRSRDHSTSLLRMYSLLFSFLFTLLNFLSFLPPPPSFVLPLLPPYILVFCPWSFLFSVSRGRKTEREEASDPLIFPVTFTVVPVVPTNDDWQTCLRAFELCMLNFSSLRSFMMKL